MRRLRKLMFSAILSAPVLLFSAQLSAQENASEVGEWKIEIDPASKARIEFISDFWDFGSIPIGSTVKYDFVFRNTGSDTLEITKVKATCGCTTAPLSSNRIAPGESAEISASLDTKKLKGTIKKSILIDCNDPINPYLKISFKARINDTLATIQTTPPVADFGSFSGKSGEKLLLDLANRSPDQMNLDILVKPPADILSASFKNKSLAAGNSTILELELKTDLGPGPFVSSLTLQAEGMTDSRITIPIKGTVVK